MDKSIYQQVLDTSVDVPETADDGPHGLRTATTIAALALLASRLFRRQAANVARSYNELRRGPAFGQLSADVIDRWAALQFVERQMFYRPIELRFRQFEAQLGQQIDRQLRSIGIVANPVFNVGLSRTSAYMVEQSARLVADEVSRRVRLLADQARTAAVQATLHSPDRLPSIDFRQRTKALDTQLRRQVVDITWTYQTAVQVRQYQDAGIEYATWMTQKDERVRKTHKSRAGQVYKIAEGLEGAQPGAEPGCRCYPVPKLPGYRP